MLESFIALPDAQKITLIGTLITAVIALTTLGFTIKINKKTTYTGLVTKERIDSMNLFKKNSSNFNSIIYSFINCPEESIDRRELYNLKNLLEYQINDDKVKEQDLVIKLNNIIWLYETYRNEKSNDLSLFKADLIARNIPHATQLMFLNYKRFVLSVLTIEFNLFESNIKKHIKSEWDKIKSEVK